MEGFETNIDRLMLLQVIFADKLASLQMMHCPDFSLNMQVGVLSVADPGFGQGGAKNFFPRFCRCSEVKSSEQSKQYNISI